MIYYKYNIQGAPPNKRGSYLGPDSKTELGLPVLGRWCFKVAIYAPPANSHALSPKHSSVGAGLGPGFRDIVLSCSHMVRQQA